MLTINLTNTQCLTAGTAGAGLGLTVGRRSVTGAAESLWALVDRLIGFGDPETAKVVSSRLEKYLDGSPDPSDPPEGAEVDPQGMDGDESDGLHHNDPRDGGHNPW